MSTQAELTQINEPQNKGFLQVVEKFTCEGWKIVENTKNRLVFVKPESMYDEFKMFVEESNVIVVIPMPNSPVAYSTKFNNYFEASEYIISRFDDFLEAVREA